MKPLRVDVGLADTGSCIGRLHTDMHKILDEHNVESIMFEREQKKLDLYLVVARRLDDFRESINKRLQCEGNKALCGNAVALYGFATDQIRSYRLCYPTVARQRRSQPASEEAKKSNNALNGQLMKPPHSNHLQDSKPSGQLANASDEMRRPVVGP